MELLSAIISEKSTTLTQQERAKWLSRLLHWFQRPRNAEEKEVHRERIYTTRLKFLILQLRANPEWRQSFEENMRRIFVDLIASHQLSSAGLPDETSFFQDFINRVQDRILPESVLHSDLTSILKSIFDSDNEILMIDAIDEATINEFIAEVFVDKKDFEVIRSALYQSLLRMSIQLANSSVLLSNKLLKRGFSKWDTAEKSAEKIVFHFSQPAERCDLERVVSLIKELERETLMIQSNLGKMGVEIETVYTLQIQMKRINRFKLILGILDHNTSLALSTRLFFSELVRDVHESRGIKAFLASNLELLSKRVAQGNSVVGEHYLARDWSGVKSMFMSAMGGGLITSLTVFLKHFLSVLGLAGFMKGLVYSINYSFSFLAIQLAGFTLATKQPSTTAAFLAKTLAVSTRESALAILYILRTQIVAVLGNLSAAMPMCFLISFAFKMMGHPLMSEAEAEHILDSSRLFGPTVVYACFTGVLLFLSSLIAGWFENFCIVTNLPDRIQHNTRINSFFGKKGTKRMSDFIRENSNALAANLSLGLLLGLSPQLFKFLSIPLEARHITLASGGFASALPIVVESPLSIFTYVDSAGGLLLIGLCNLLVSFSLSLTLALAATEASRGSFMKLLRWTGKTIVRRPLILIYPDHRKKAKSTEDKAESHGLK